MPTDELVSRTESFKGNLHHLVTFTIIENEQGDIFNSKFASWRSDYLILLITPYTWVVPFPGYPVSIRVIR